MIEQRCQLAEDVTRLTLDPQSLWHWGVLGPSVRANRAYGFVRAFEMRTSNCLQLTPFWTVDGPVEL